MSTKQMLIDASHPEETRVAVTSGHRLEDFDVEVASRRQLKGNIYLAKVIRVEPSLQAAFVDYGGNRHGFLAFSEIHPDYYQIPVADKEELIAEQKAEAEEDSENGDGEGENGEAVETLGGDEAEEVAEKRSQPLHRKYKIQEVIKRRQILLVQVVKEERGNKGAALTTYMSLAGRYCVLMPNTARGGGISRKITNSADRKKLKKMLSDLDIPEGMAVIVRTAGTKRTKTEIKRDYEYLIRLWSTVRDLTLKSTAPALVHEEGDLIKRSIRDLYNSEIENIVVEGDDAYRRAKDFMKLLIPSHAKKVQPYKDTSTPIMSHYGVEGQLDAIHNPVVHLPSGGYIVINPTEALVSIDVNSGKSTKERNIEETALRTNLEASEEVARQLKLRDLAGLIVIDYIDMDQSKNQSRVERCLKDAMRSDRARIQIGRISPFGLMELSRQRLRPSLIETSSEPCPHCEGTGVRRSTDSTAVAVLRAIEDACSHDADENVTVYVPTAVALYILNHKREALAKIESQYGVSIELKNDDTLIPPDHRIEGAKAPERNNQQDAKPKRKRRRRGRRREEGDAPEDETADAEAAESAETEAETEDDDKDTAAPRSEEDEDGETRPKRRRRGRRGGRRRRRGRGGEGEGEGENAEQAATAEDGTSEGAPEAAVSEAPEAAETTAGTVAPEGEDAGEDADKGETAEAKPKTRAKTKTKAKAKTKTKAKAKTKTKAKAKTKKAAKDDGAADADAAAAAAPEASDDGGSDAGEDKPARKGWWSRASAE